MDGQDILIWFLIGIFIIGLILANEPAKVAKRKGQSAFPVFLMSILFTPIAGFLMVIANGDQIIKD